jgi:hypothetical protein
MVKTTDNTDLAIFVFVFVRSVVNSPSKFIICNYNFTFILAVSEGHLTLDRDA